jgi:ribonuclease HI
MVKKEHLELRGWTDGSCDNNPTHKDFAKGGWAFCLLNSKDELLYEDFGVSFKTTSQKMELQAVINLIKFVKKNYLINKRIYLKIFSDSAYIVNAFNEHWYSRWIEQDFFGIKNVGLWKILIKLYNTELMKIEFIKVKGHNGLEWNEYADFLAGEARKSIIK